MPIVLPRLYCIVDSGRVADGRALDGFVRELLAGGASLIQYRNKSGDARRMLSDAREMARVVADREASLRREGTTPSAHGPVQRPAADGSRPLLIMNDRADLCLLAGFAGVHVGQHDLSPDAARRVVGTRLWVGVSTHTAEQVEAADRSSADYLAVGPVFPTAGKRDPDPVIGLEGVRDARRRTGKPLVAIGGITRANGRAVIDAGADSVAVISDLAREPRKAVEEFLEILTMAE